MNKIYLIPFLSGISTLLGIIPTYFKNNENIINKSLSYSLGIMITLSIIDLIPEALSYQTNINIITILITLIFITLGIILSNIIDSIIKTKINNNKLYRLGIVSLIALILHNIPEGILTYITTKNNFKLGLKLSLGIALHNIPEGIAIAVPLFYSTNNRKKAYTLTLISALSEIFGVIIARIFLEKIINNLLLSFILSITAGIMIYISLYELIPNIKEYKNKKITYKYIILGIITMFICHLILN